MSQVENRKQRTENRKQKAEGEILEADFFIEFFLYSHIHHVFSTFNYYFLFFIFYFTIHSMPMSDVFLVIQWWSALFLVGVAAFPLTKRLFGPPTGGWPATRSPALQDEGWYDRGYFFSKAVGFAVVSYIVFLLGTLRIAPFTNLTIYIALGGTFVLGMIGVMIKKYHSRESGNLKIPHQVRDDKKQWHLAILIVVEELFFFGALLFWSWVKAHEPSIQGLEKFMDYGFMQSILNSSWFPAPDMWWQGGFINYYYFGHLVTAVLTKLSGLDLSVTFNLMLATLFALTLTMSFSIGYQLSRIGKTRLRQGYGGQVGGIGQIVAGLLTAFLVTLAGNMQTIYVFTKGYVGDAVVPFWTILWSPLEFFSNVGEGMNRYWYANATRFIPFTIHEFPSYSFVVSDVHGHVLSIPFVLLAIALLIMVWTRNNKQKTDYLFYGFLLGILLMTNALDGPIYFGLLGAILVISNFQYPISNIKWMKKIFLPLIIVGIMTLLTALPFLIHFKSFATGIGVNCPLEFLANSKIGPFLFEGVEKCQKSPLWMMELLWGFFWFTGAWLFIKKIWEKEEYDRPVNRILKTFFLFGIVLIIIPEFFYVKDIYPAHFRSNTMFKLGYEAFILWSIVSAYVIVHFVFMRRHPLVGEAGKTEERKQIWFFRFPSSVIRPLFFILLFPQLFLVSIFPIFSVRSYFGELKTYQSIYGLAWLEKEYPDDYAAITWLKYQISNIQYPINTNNFPVIVEADGDSYTDYNHVSAFSGVPTIVGWAVHEWLWRGGYDEVAPRREEVKKIYTSADKDEIRAICAKYRVRYIIAGKLEREKYPDLAEENIASIGTAVFQSGDTVVYDVGER
jgi:YYY domain-containing protein